jgi:membrane protein implicated in regulation of membrane protease activity
MGPFDRGILVIYTLTLTLLFLAAAVFLAGWQALLLPLAREAFLPENREILWALLAVYVIMGIWLLWKGIRVGRSKRKQAIVHERSLGQVRVSLPAIESLAEKTVSSVEGVKEARARVEALPQGINIILKVIVAPDVNIPSLSEDMQRLVKDKIYNVVGIAVNEVQVAVESFFIRKTRVE